MKYNLLCFAIGVLFGTFLSLVYCTAALGINQPLIPVASPEELKKEVEQTETVYAKSFDTLKKHSDKLRTELATTKVDLQQAKQRSKALQGQVYSLLDSRFEKQRANATATSLPCDTLATAIDELMQANATKDTLYEQMTANLEEQIRNKDTTIALKDAQYADLQNAFNKSIESQELLAAQNKLLNKEYKKQKVKSKLLSAVLFALSGAAATYFLHR